MTGERIFIYFQLFVILEIASVFSRIRDACSCSFLLIHRAIFPSYFESALRSAADADRIQVSDIFAFFKDLVIALYYFSIFSWR